MTLHCAMTFFEGDKPAGFLIGSDSQVQKIDFAESGEVLSYKGIYSEKLITGDNYLGVAGGLFFFLNRPLPKNLGAELSTIDGMFTDIEEGKTYTHIPLLNDAGNYYLLLARKSQDMIDLFSIANNDMVKIPHIANRLYSVKGIPLTVSESWFGPIINMESAYHHQKEGRPYSYQEAFSAVYKMLSDEKKHDLPKGMKLGKPFIYVVDFEKKGRINYR